MGAPWKKHVGAETARQLPEHVVQSSDVGCITSLELAYIRLILVLTEADIETTELFETRGLG